MRPSYEPIGVRCRLCGATQAVNSAVNDVLGQPESDCIGLIGLGNPVTDPEDLGLGLGLDYKLRLHYVGRIEYSRSMRRHMCEKLDASVSSRPR